MLTEPSWTPSGGEQSAGRVHRPKQTKECWIYRFATTGSVDETILDRQAGKSSLLTMLQNETLPTGQSDDRALLFDLDAPSVASRLCANAQSDSPYCDEKQWVSLDLTEQPQARHRAAVSWSAAVLCCPHDDLFLDMIEVMS
jgi:hypothetical protein